MLHTLPTSIFFDLITFVWYVLGERRDAYGALRGKPEGKMLLGRHVEMEGEEKWVFKEEDEGNCFDMDRQRDLVNTVMTVLIPRNAGNFFSS
jgi:hypothetical protein